MKSIWTVLILAAAPAFAGGDTGKINDAERAFLLAQLEQSRQGVLAALQGVSPAQWRYKPAPDVWSVQECAEHIVLSEEYIFSMAQQLLRSPAVDRPASSNSEYDKALVGKIEDRSQKGKAPEPLVPSQRFAAPADAAREFAARRDKTIAYVKATAEDLRVHVGPTPAGPLDVYQVLLLQSAHSARHTAQIREVQASGGYPKTAGARSRFLVAYTMARTTLDKLTPEEMAKVQEHGAYLMSQVQKGVIVWGGRTADPANPHGYVEIAVASEAQAKDYVAGDPAVRAGIFRCTIEAFEEIPGVGKM